jgi:hypothetical protein
LSVADWRRYDAALDARENPIRADDRASTQAGYAGDSVVWAMSQIRLGVALDDKSSLLDRLLVS